ncbi:piezo-type mechanosensitive ion channel component isoform X2 [Drosophila pseudoobscura]|uniref:Piezo-type mechanosensitive ion channel component n=1 Tax=Drosophila pseudoobscura pseudoobscura TaxID=46245 RepID=A0A6I8WET6_DROPS|nr:piezo-type mechanosensitive ion channel component isoform X2 [Drosophila pseudoobscura]
MAEFVLLMLVRILLPVTLIIVSLVRPVGLSFVYLFMFFMSPWLLQTKSRTQRTMLHAYLIVLCVLSVLFIIGHIIINLVNLFHFRLALSIEQVFILRQVGFIYFKRLRLITVMQWILPDIFIFICTLALFIFAKISAKKQRMHFQDEEEEIIRKNRETSGSLKMAEMNRLLIIVYIRSILKTSPIFSLIVLYFAATLRPSLPGSLYFLMFIIAGTYWAIYRQLHRGMHYPLIFMVIALSLHITFIIGCQLPVVQKLINTDTIWSRIMGMEILLRLSEHNNNGKIIEFNQELNVDSYLSPVALMLAYFVTTLNLIHRAQYELTFNSIRMNLGPKPNDIPSQKQTVHESNELISPNAQPSMLEQFFYMLFDITSVIYKNSYILMNTIMMIWSIVYHSWLTFVLLIWANILWMIPNQRRSMMRSSFFVVLFAEFLVVTQYIYGMNIYEEELPTKVTSCGFNLEQIGFVHPQNKGSQPWIPLTVKTGFLFTFWITSRQYFKEKAEDRTQSDLLQQIFGPHHSRSEHLLFEKSQAPRLIVFIFKSVTNFITRIWMWLLIFLIFLCAMIDRVMTGFRICYMSLFLLFLMVFQMSLQLWIKFLYGYWMFLIFYAMSILTVIYTYQFDNFDYYWHQFLNVQPTLQNDIGLRRYQTKELFLHLLIPTLTVIFTVVQLHYFHRLFMDSVRRPKPTDQKIRGSIMTFNVGSNTPQKVFDTYKQSWKVFFSAGYRKLRSKGRRWFRPGKLITWGFLEMHMIKAVILTSFYCAISEVCFFNFFLVLLSLISVCVNRFLRRVIFRVVTFWVSVLVLMKMIYQIKYLDQSQYDYKCKNNTVNFAEWMGLSKMDPTFSSLLRYISPYIVYMIVTSLHAVVKLRDHLIRYSMFKRKERKVLFPKISRQDAERDFAGLIKYLLNYGYFKFGLEITLIGIVSTIALRRDLLALTYAVWLILLLSLNRMQCARIWEILQLYFVLSIFVQYLYLLNFPPNLCAVSSKDSPYANSTNTIWKMLDNSTKLFYKSKLMLDFIVLLLISRQRKSFKAEIHHIDGSYRGGDNKNVVYNIAKLGHVYFENPTHDFCSYVRNYADVLKTAVFCGFFWITLAIVFMGGVCSMDILSLGYIIFALVFLLQGSEVYLQNIHYIICRWNCLIAFNILNIVVKVSIIVLENTIKAIDKPFLNALFTVLHHDRSFALQKSDQYNVSNEFNSRDEDFHYGPKKLIFKNTLVWHAIIFAFIIFQHRIFRSYYFCHIIMDTQANTILASRGASIIENLHYKQIYDRREYEKNVLESVKAKMERIRASNRKNFTKISSLDAHNFSPRTSMHVQYSAEVRSVLQDYTAKPAKPNTHVTDMYFTRSPQPKRRDLRLHPHAVRTGDYYMFEEFDDDDDMDVYEEYDFLEKEDLRARQMRLPSKSKTNPFRETRGSQEYSYEESSDSDYEDFDTHPVIKLTSELIVLLTFRLNRLSRNYRFVHKVLSAEKKTLQEISTMNRLGLSNTAAMFDFLNQSLNEKISASGKDSGINLVSKGDDFTTLDHNDFVRMLISMWYALIANTQAICYLAVFINQAANSSIISLPMPFLVLCWGSLTLPRPTKTFWVTLITYTLAMIFFKSIMHQKIVLDQQFINRKKNTVNFELVMKHGNAVYDLLLLVVLFWHRYMLKKQGIWTMLRTNSEVLLLERNPSKIKRTYSKEKPADILERLRQEAGGEPKDPHRSSGSPSEFDRDIDDVLRPSMENKYVYQNIESEYYRRTMQRLAHKGGFLSAFYKFFSGLRYKARLSTDVYTLIFLCDFVNFFVLLFGFPKFAYRHKYTTSVLQTYIQGNKVPFSFLLMLVVQFLTIVTERAIYLRKALIYKIVFHFVTVVGIHIWMFFLVPYVTGHSFGETAPVIFYLVKCLHMLLSAYQIRCGYPKRILGNVFTKGYSLVNYVAFKIYMEIPFLYILRTMLDWSVFIVRCYRQMDTDFPVLRGEPKALYVKLLVGGTIILILIALIWSPLFIFALIGTVGKPNIPRRADITVKIGHYEPIYVSQSYSGIHQFSDANYKELTNSFYLDNYATDHIRVYDAVDITAIKFDANSLTLWNMSPPDKKRLLSDLKNGKKLEIRLNLSLKTSVTTETITTEMAYTLTRGNKKIREMLIKMMYATNSNARVIIPDILPKFITVQKQDVKIKFIKDYNGKYARPIILEKKEDDGKVWWNMYDYCNDKFYTEILSSLPRSDCEGGVVFYIFNDKSFPSTMSFLEKTGIIGLYTTFVYVVSRVIRSLIANNHRRIMFEDLPYVDRVLKLCNDIYLVRETQEYRLEEDLYGKLLFLYRSPETLIKWTRFKEDLPDDISTSQLSMGKSKSSINDDDSVQTSTSTQKRP